MEEQSFKNNLINIILNMMFSKNTKTLNNDFIGLKLKT